VKTIFFMISLVVSMLGTAISPTSAADQATNPPSQPQVLSDINNYQGDLLKFPVNVVARFSNTSTAVCIPAWTALRWMSSVADGSLNVTVDRPRGFWTRIWYAIAFWKWSDQKPLPLIMSSKFSAAVSHRFDLYSACNIEDAHLIRNGKAVDSVTLNNRVLNIPKVIVDQSKPDRFGLSYGGLIVPYKYHFTGSKQFNANTTLAPYMGYRIDKETLGRSIELIGFVGAAPVSASQNVNGQSTTQTLAGFSYGGGIIGKLKDTFQWGVVIGADRVGGGSTYPDNGKPWVAIELGYSFSQ
jgi:hypothetical protein